MGSCLFVCCCSMSPCMQFCVHYVKIRLTFSSTSSTVTSTEIVSTCLRVFPYAEITENGDGKPPKSHNAASTAPASCQHRLDADAAHWNVAHSNNCSLQLLDSQAPFQVIYTACPGNEVSTQHSGPKGYVFVCEPLSIYKDETGRKACTSTGIGRARIVSTAF
jgi:hypothetical protein